MRLRLRLCVRHPLSGQIRHPVQFQNQPPLTPRAPRGRRLSAGFTLLEVVVALVILASAGLVLFSWISQNLATASRLKDAQVRAQLHTEGVAWLATLNPAAEPEGELEQGGLRLQWRSTLVEPMRPEDTYGGNLTPRWLLGLYRVQASITRLDTGLVAQWQQQVAGWKPAMYATVPAPAGSIAPAGRPR